MIWTAIFLGVVVAIDLALHVIMARQLRALTEHIETERGTDD